MSPIDIFSKNEALELRKEIEKIEKEIPNEINSSGRYNYT